MNAKQGSFGRVRFAKTGLKLRKRLKGIKVKEKAMRNEALE